MDYLRPSNVVHTDLTNFFQNMKLNNHQKITKEGVKKVSNYHLEEYSQPYLENIQLIDTENLTYKNIRRLLQQPIGMMYIELGGQIIKDNKFIFKNSGMISGFDPIKSHPIIFFPEQYQMNWHFHPWNANIGGKPSWFSLQDIRIAFEQPKTIKVLFVHNPCYYHWPTEFIFCSLGKHTNEDIQTGLNEINEDILKHINEAPPGLPPSVDWDRVKRIFRKRDIYLEYNYKENEVEFNKKLNSIILLLK